MYDKLYDVIIKLQWDSVHVGSYLYIIISHKLKLMSKFYKIKYRT